MQVLRRNSSPRAVLAATVVLALAAALPACAQNTAAAASQPEALRALRAAVASEFQASRTDKSIWMYTDTDKTPGKDSIYHSIETRQGTLRRLVELNGQPVTGSAQQAETQRIDNYIHDTSAQQKARKNGAHDDAQAAQLLKMLPDAFIWTVVSQTPEFITLSFRPNPNFAPPDIEARVMSNMGGDMIIARNGDRIRTLRGHLTSDVLIGWGILGRLYKGGTFDIERRMVGDGHWQITQTNVHIAGHALIFKTIGQQDDESKTDWHPSTCDTLQQAAQLLGAAR